MSSVIRTVRQGDTEAINFTLYSNGSAANITGYTSAAMYLVSRQDSSTAVSFTTAGGTFTVGTAASGACSISPSATSFLNAKSPYRGYVIVIDGTGKRSSFPEDGEIVFNVLERLSNDI